jgi:CRP/FNR family transcriptional regulator, cyclic AMP receptor protein
LACEAELLKDVPLFSLLDADERAILAGHVEMRRFGRLEAIYRQGDPGGAAYVLIEGRVRVTLIDEDQQDVVVDEPEPGGFFGFASLLEGTPHQTNALALSTVVCLEIDRHDLRQLIEKKPDAGMDMLAVLGKQFHASQKLVQTRSLHNPNDVIAETSTFGNRIADAVARFGGSWSFIISFGVILVVYTAINVVLGGHAWDPYPFILLNLFLSMLAAIQAPVIMMSQNRQDAKDRVRGEMDYEVNRRSEVEIRGLSAKLQELHEKMDHMQRLIRTDSGSNLI